jgi:hypothetical protein
MGKAAARIAEFSHHEFTLDLQTDDKEKDGHQAVVEPQQQRLVQLEVSNCQTKSDLPDISERGRPRGVRQ